MKRTGLLLVSLVLVSPFFFPLPAISSQDIISPLVKNAPVLDGSGTDASWQAAQTYTIRDKRLDLDITLKSVHTENMVFFYVQFPDATENKLQKPWVWNKDLEIYTIGPQREDTFMFRWNMEDHDVDLSNYSDDNFKADIWYWKSHRSNPSGYADDKIHTLSDIPEKKSRLMVSHTEKKKFLLRLADEGSPMYKKYIEVDYKGDIIPQYTLVMPMGSRADVQAKGTWQEGKWTIEFARKIKTGHGDDVQFETGSDTRYLFGISIKSLYGEPIDDAAPNLYGQGRISEPLYLILK